MNPVSPLSIMHSDETRLTPFVCPGCTVGISRAVHLARLNAGWEGCDRCEWRFDTEGLAERSVAAVASIREQRSQGIRRTEYGLRGQYLNQLTRHSAARLAQVFCESFIHPADRLLSAGRTRALRSSSTTGTEPRTGAVVESSRRLPGESEEVRLERTVIPAVVAGYDGRPSSPDIFVGVIGALREFGLHVIDIGRCTAASMAEAIRSLPRVTGGMLVTGSGCSPAYTGMDAFDRQAEPVAVVWKDHGLQIRAAEDGFADASESGLAPDSRESLVDALLPKKSGAARLALPHMLLDLPDNWVTSRPGRRMSRQSGSHTHLDFEMRYRTWLAHWFPRNDSNSVIVRTDDGLVAERIQWLAEHCELNLLRRTRSDQSQTASGALVLDIDEDDRGFQVTGRQGQQWTISELADVINRRPDQRPAHVTAHADPASRRFWLTDRARPTSGCTEENIRDALVVLGLLLRRS